MHAQRTEARRLWLAALDQKAEFRTASTLALLRAAIRADSSYFLPYDLYISELKALSRFSQLRREFPKPPRTASVLAQCVSGAARLARGFDLTALTLLLKQLDRLPDPSGCRAAIGARYRQSAAAEASLLEVREALSREPESDNSVWIAYADILTVLGRKKAAAAVLVDAIRRSPHAVHSLMLQLRLAGQRELMGDSAGARNLRAAIGASVARDGRPYLRYQHVKAAANLALQSGHPELFNSLTQEQIRVAHDANAPDAEREATYSLGLARLTWDKDPNAAIPPLTSAILLAERVGTPTFIMEAYRHRGRAFQDVGDFRRAESDQRKALAATAEDDAYSLAQVHHNLAHAFEGQGRWREALREAELFGAYTKPLREQADYMMSLREGGMIRWKAGWHAAAREPFIEMVRVVERLEASYLYAGEYYERIGDFARALGYYRRGAAENRVDDGPGNLAGLTRMYEALGMRDSARASATRHDQAAHRHGTPRLLPAILLADGRVDEALRLARYDVREQEVKRSVPGVTSATIQLARLLIDAGRTGEAAREGATAERLAAAANLTAEIIDAIHVQGLAQLRERSTESITTLLRARALLRAHRIAAAEVSVETALGDAFAAFGRRAEALASYDAAATSSQDVTASYEEALDRARNRDQRAAPFDGALRVVLGMSESRVRSEQLFVWSARKKDAVLNRADTGGVVARSKPSLTNLQRALAPGSAVVNYIAVDSGIVALVVTTAAARVVKLPLSVSATSDLVQRVRRPLVAVDAGQLDLARAPFDLGLAHQLYAGLFAPLEHLLGGIQRITIVPDGPLYGVPFNALPRTPPEAPGSPSAYHAADYLIDRFNFTLATSPALAGVRTLRGVQPGARVLIVRGNVEGSDREVASIMAAWPAEHATSIAGGAATESALRKQVAGRSVIHFAVHAHADETDALASYLELARDSTDDGFLHLAEIAALKFRGDLVVLTGCETLPGRVFAGTGPFGIANSFIAAGAGRVIATHWPVGESAAELSRDLHRALANGVDASDALRAAQLRLRRDPARAHPFYWGGYVIVEGAER